MNSWSRLALQLAQQHGPRLIREVRRAMNDNGAPGPGGPGPSGRAPSPDRRARTHPTADHAMRIDYAPQLDGRADPGEVVWTWVTFEEDANQGKDRPVLVVGRSGAGLLGLMLSSQGHRRDDADWMSVGTGEWDREHRESFVRLDRVLEVQEDGIRREGAIMGRDRFDQVANRLRSGYGWS
ncbi:type II toxin-antitoxin system PemK/MazF family toxin [Williamsia sterculiae]|uniref:PemK-like, MazF-like toxin of type II toxin-antitoxin system n=1 Tax=Williamsia sterculiae TaxID=1344003 RepID=A0A1N7G5X9_9NOCA|nr:type II toxin-antitoxin system PemK/MazF family toxin [Williamsia sterculiae]SIS07958.1 PemK-like, MazF-like toxin of type II toxin-antitoxin system [Williamsia sterculiae]